MARTGSKRHYTYQAAVTVRCSEVRMSEDWPGFGLLFFKLHDSRISRLTLTLGYLISFAMQSV